jgi:sugar O-acyltransferase (sialic acid O-acetyltransferase NeuD family)
MKKSLVVFGTSNILSDIFDCALANQLSVSKIVLHLPEEVGERDRTLADRLQDFSTIGDMPVVVQLDEFMAADNEVYILGPTTPTRAVLAAEVQRRFGIKFTQLVHPTAYVSPLARMGEGVFVGANSVVGPGVKLADHVFVNRGVTIGHDTCIGSFSRIQPGSNLGGLSNIGKGVTVGIGATLIERLVIGDDAFIGAGAVVTSDVATSVLVVGIPAKFKKNLST